MTANEQKEIFCKNFRRYVDNSGKTQRDIAKDLGYSYTTVNTWYRGSAIPNAAKIQTLADYFRIKKSDLLDAPTDDEPVFTDPKDRFVIKFRDGDDSISPEDKEQLTEFIASTIDQYYKIKGLK